MGMEQGADVEKVSAQINDVLHVLTDEGDFVVTSNHYDAKHFGNRIVELSSKFGFIIRFVLDRGQDNVGYILTENELHLIDNVLNSIGENRRIIHQDFVEYIADTSKKIAAALPQIIESLANGTL
jgi:hypothetical protein